MLSHPDEIELMRAGWSAIPAGEISAAIRECRSSCGRHACPNLATWWSEPRPALLTGALSRARRCVMHVRELARAVGS